MTPNLFVVSIGLYCSLVGRRIILNTKPKKDDTLAMDVVSGFSMSKNDNSFFQYFYNVEVY